MRATTTIALAVLATGCAENAVLELRVELPANPTPDDPVYVQVQPRRASDNPFTDDWRGDDVEPIELPPDATVDHISVVSEQDDVDLAVKVRFCRTETCTGFGDEDPPALWFLVEDPFYIGEHSEADLLVTEVPAVGCTEGMADCPVRIDRCDVRGCTGGDPPTTFCRLDGRHLCD